MLFAKTIAPAWSFVAWDGNIIPPDSILMLENGQHTGSDNAAVLTDSNASFGIDTYNTGYTIRNTSKGESATITDTTDTTITGVLSGGADWDQFEYYEIIFAGLETGDKIHYETSTNLGGTVQISVKGIVTITGSNGTHTFNYYLEDITDLSTSATSLYTAQVV